ncbi:MAG: tRNA uridine-5-carboxymethylaminomethyl(34) synthesis GTPase MnmE, partial [Lachnospiraceae bacterium]
MTPSFLKRKISVKTDTIAAIASAMSNAGIGIIRISGDESISVVNKIFQNKQGKSILEHAKSHTIHYGFIYDGNELIDEVLIMIMKSPNSYTTEDIIEIDCHGGILVMNRILETVIKHGARLAEPGEFTKRAFLNGRIDLSKAEAVSDMINAQNDYARKSSIHQLKGSLFDKIHKMREDILYEIAFIESALDDPEHISLEGYPNQLRQKVRILIEEINKLICSYQNGKILSEGIHTVIVGKPNAGKSSLLNRLVGEDKAIVTSIAGTTRDILEEKIQLHGIQLNMIDTAGICSTNDEIEKIGIAKAKKYALDADLIIYVVDASIPLDEKDTQIIHLIRDKKKIILLNKTDLEVKVTEEMLLTRLKECGDTQINNNIIKTSTKTNQGIDLFEDAIRDMFFQGELNFNDEVFLTNLRHKEA